MKVLIVDDNKVNRRIAAAGVARLNCAVIFEAVDGAECVAHAAAELPDIIVLDVDMPNVDGPTALRMLQTNPATARIPVVFFTARSDTERLRCLGAAAILEKPMDTGDLTDRLLQILVKCPSQARERSGQEEGRTPCRLRILVADDDEDCRTLFEYALSTRFEVLTVPDGRSALTRAVEWRPDAVLLDVRMPLLMGHDAALELRRALASQVPRILGYSADEPPRELRAMFDEFFLKPARPRQLVRRVVDALGLPRS